MLVRVQCRIFQDLSDKNKMAAKRGGAGHTGGEGCTPYNGLYRAAPPERGTFFRLQVYERVGILHAEVYDRAGKSVIW